MAKPEFVRSVAVALTARILWIGLKQLAVVTMSLATASLVVSESPIGPALAPGSELGLAPVLVEPHILDDAGSKAHAAPSNWAAPQN